MSSYDTSLVGRGREAMVPEEGLPFDVTRRRGGAGPRAAGGRSRGALPADPAALRRETVAAVFDGVDWNGTAGEPPAPTLDQPASRYFAAFPWAGAHAAAPPDRSPQDVDDPR